jgi:pyridoxal 5'-phosphate synthase pdxT subunit
VVSASGTAPQVGVLGLQGDVDEHEAILASIGVTAVRVRSARDLAGVEALVLPGGESTTLSMLLTSGGLFEPLGEAIASGMPVLGTCAGMILLAREILDGRPDQRCFAAIDIAVRRNGFGRQRASFEADLGVVGISGGPMRAAFIRAPIVESVGAPVEVLAEVVGPDGACRPVVCRQGSALAAAFHPELSGDGRLHALLVEMALGKTPARLGVVGE